MKWFTGDHHFNHKNIIESCNRPFKNVWAMNHYMIEKWNEYVQDGDLVYHLGDFAFPNKGDGHDISDILDMLSGQIILILGNHDHKNMRKYFDRFVKVCDIDYFKLDNGQRVMLCHYSMRTWRASCHGSWHLYGHSHGTLLPLKNSLDVGVDTNDFRPYSVEHIIDLMESR